MSNLAPFVAAVLRDRTMAEMVQEISMLREYTDQRLLAQVTGPGGSPVYYEGSLKGGSSYTAGSGWIVPVEQKREIDLAALRQLEVRLGGVAVQRFDVFEYCYTNRYSTDFDRENPDIPQMGVFSFYRTEGQYVSVREVLTRMGPINYDDYRGCSGMPTSELISMHRETGIPQRAIITHVEFIKAQISGIIDLLEKMGVSTGREDEDDDAYQYDSSEEEEDNNNED